VNDFDFVGLELSLSVVRGARSFRLEDGLLTGLVYRQVWTPGENLAMCRVKETFISESRRQFDLPDDTRYQTKPSDTLANCRHGFYAYSSSSSDFPTANSIRAMIEGYGEVMIGTKGFRCMKARIVALQTTDPVSLTAMCQNYADIPRFDTFEHMLAEYPIDIPD
jgi:hypothetical protein